MNLYVQSNIYIINMYLKKKNALQLGLYKQHGKPTKLIRINPSRPDMTPLEVDIGSQPSKTNSGKSSGEFSLLKPKPPDPIEKPFQLRLNLPRSSDNHASYAQIRLHLALLHSNLTSFGADLTMLCSPPLSSDNILFYSAQIQPHLALLHLDLVAFGINPMMSCSPPLSSGNILLCSTQIRWRTIDCHPLPLLNWLHLNWLISHPSPIQLGMW